MTQKKNIKYRCKTCGYVSQNWLGRCPECENWNTFIEEIISKKEKLPKKKTQIYTLKDAPLLKEERIKTDITEIDRIFGGGIMNGSLTLLGGPPGIGKSTIALQISEKLANKGKKVMYVSGEESIPQIKNRSKRLGIESENIYIMTETNLENITERVKEISPKFLVIDSIQAIYDPNLSTSPGTVIQIKESAQQLLSLTKSSGITTLILGHITKSGEIAGPKILEHIVDTVLYFESEINSPYRVIRVHKNRFGPTSDVGIFEMSQKGLKEVPNPSFYFISERAKGSPGSVIISTVQGSKSILLEVQALISRTNYSLPRRIFTGFDFNRGIILLSVLEKRLDISFREYDVFVNIVGGIRITEPSADLGICMSIFSAYFNYLFQPDILFIGEVGLGSEIRGVSRCPERVAEANKVGFKKIIFPKANSKELYTFQGKLKLIGVENLAEAIEKAKRC